MRALPKTLQRAIAARFADRFDEGWSEQDGWSEQRNGWSHWVYLKPGWRNAVIDPFEALHAIHEPTIAECLRQLRGAAPCDCDECQRELVTER